MNKRSNIVILPPDDPNKKKLGFELYEIPSDWDKSADEFFKIAMTAQKYREWLAYQSNKPDKPMRGFKNESEQKE